MRFLIDRGLGISVAQWLRDRVHDAIHLREQGLMRASDQQVFDKAREERRIVITCDLDFGEIVALSRATVSVIVLRVVNPSAARVAGRLEVVLATSAAALNSGAIVVVEDSRLRIRSLPIGA